MVAVLHGDLGRSLVNARPVATELARYFPARPNPPWLSASVFARPGVGRLALDAIENRDMPLVNGCILLFATVFIVINRLVDLLYAAAKPTNRIS